MPRPEMYDEEISETTDISVEGLIGELEQLNGTIHELISRRVIIRREMDKRMKLYYEKVMNLDANFNSFTREGEAVKEMDGPELSYPEPRRY